MSVNEMNAFSYKYVNRNSRELYKIIYEEHPNGIFAAGTIIVVGIFKFEIVCFFGEMGLETMNRVSDTVSL